MNTADYIKEKIQEFREKFDKVEFLHGVPVSLPKNTQKDLESFLIQSIEEAEKRGREEAIKEMGEKTKAIIAIWAGRDEYKCRQKFDEYLASLSPQVVNKKDQLSDQLSSEEDKNE